MKSNGLSSGIGLIVLSGCSAYGLPPLSMNHPAYLQAAIAPPGPISNTLAYGRDDMPAVVAADQGTHEGHHRAPEANPQKIVTGEGKVIATVPNARQVVVEHGEIKDFMGAMTMGYRVEPPSLLEGVTAGDQVRFTINVPDKTIVKLEKVK